MESTAARSGRSIDEAVSVLGRRLFLCSVFAAGLVLLDPALLRAGNAAVTRGLIVDDPFAAWSQSSDTQVVLLGDCRPAILDTPFLSREMGKRVLNLGASMSGLGHILFGSQLLRSRGGYDVVVFLNDDIMATDEQRVVPEMALEWIWSPYLPSENRKRLESDFPQGLGHSGLWRFRGKGTLLARAALHALKGTRPVAHESEPIAFFGDASMVGREKDYTPNPRLPTDYALGHLDRALSDLAATVPVTLVLSPMHYLRATPEARERFVQEAKSLARRHGLELVNHFDNQAEWAHRSDWWGDTGHLNRKGLAAYMPTLARDLREALQ